MSSTEVPIVIYACNWDGLSCVEAAARVGHCYPSSVRLVRVSCLSRLNQGLILRAFELGAEGVMLLGCSPGNCQYDRESDLVSREYEKARTVLRLLGMGEDRLVLSLIPRGDGYGFVRQITAFLEQLRAMRSAVPAGSL